MLDLKAKLASAGLVSEEDIARVDKEGQGRKTKGRRGGKGKGRGPDKVARAAAKASHHLDVAALQGVPRGEAYVAVRRWVERVRVDAPGKTPSETAATFHFATESGQVGRLVVEADVHQWLQDGTAGVVAFMGNHGLTHAVVPADAARELRALFPAWVRALAEPEP